MPLFMVALVAITPILLFFVAEQAAFTAGSTTPLIEISDFISIAGNTEETVPQATSIILTLCCLRNSISCLA